MGTSTNSQFEIHTLEWFSKNQPAAKLSAYEILWVKRGTGILQVNLQESEIRDQTIYCLRPGQLRKLNTMGRMEGYYLSLSADFLYLAETTLSFSLLSDQNQPLQIAIDEETQNEVEEILIKMRKEFVNYFSFRLEILQGLFKIFLLYTSRKFPYTITFTKDAELLRRFMQLLHEHFITKKMVTDYADALNVTPSYLNQVVKKISGYTASYHIQQYLVTEAKKQAIYSNRSMKEIAYALGFNDMAHFSKFFKNNSGVNFTNFKKGIPLMIQH
ncbi:AraC family transcriptional regulator [Chitinophaga sp. SYP-B3965]|uniref:helix-turn-helix domain-containing protein n=1 Tax=Chitinophaga sp. SYP-B3965 TaxID=2663120 RepID=UPI00156347C7|nr:helix-turn-helix domain-containing protein [Chitinophaga sp. SYP-B3965]